MTHTIWYIIHLDRECVSRVFVKVKSVECYLSSLFEPLSGLAAIHSCIS